jgi:DNA-directed RNA polymerase specialized sigma24 family protein
VVEAPAVRSLVELARAGDPSAFESLVRARTDAMYRLSLAIVGNETDAADALQESLIGAWRHLPGLRDVGSFEVWLERIVVNTCRMSLRARSRREVREIPLGQLDPVAGPAAGRDDAAMLKAAITLLSRARFTPKLEILDATDNVALRDGDAIQGACGNNPDTNTLYLEPPFR